MGSEHQRKSSKPLKPHTAPKNRSTNNLVDPSNFTPNTIVRLQGLIGNQAVQRVLKKSTPDGIHRSPPGTESPYNTPIYVQNAYDTLPDMNAPAQNAYDTLPDLNSPAQNAYDTLPDMNAPAQNAYDTLPDTNPPAPEYSEYYVDDDTQPQNAEAAEQNGEYYVDDDDNNAPPQNAAPLPAVANINAGVAANGEYDPADFRALPQNTAPAVTNISAGVAANGEYDPQQFRALLTRNDPRAGNNGATIPQPTVVQPPAPKAKLTPEQKSKKYFARGGVQFKQRNHAEAGVLFGRAFEISRVNLYARWAAAAFEAAGDVQRAAIWYRKLMDEPDDKTTDEQEDMEAASGFFTVHNLPQKPEYEAMKDPDAHYVTPTKENLNNAGVTDKGQQRQGKESGLSLEEISPKDTASAMVSKKINLLLNADSSMSGAKLKKVLTKILGLDMDVEQVTVEYILETQVASQKWTLEQAQKWLKTTAEIDRDLSHVDPKQTPLWNQIKNFKVEYLKSTADRQPYQLHDKQSKLYQGQTSDEPYDTKDSSTVFAGPGYAIYVMTGDGEIYASEHKLGKFHHSSLLGGAESASAGEIKVSEGQFMEISNKSGHYKSEVKHLAQAILQFIDMGQNPLKVTVWGEIEYKDFEPRDWGSDGASFVNLYLNDRVKFDDKWKNELKFTNWVP